MRPFYTVLLVLACTAASQALSLRPQSDLELAATADIIVIGVVTSVASTAAKENYLAGAGKAAIAVKRVIAGSPQKMLNIKYPTPPKKGGLQWGVTLTKGEKKLFFLEFAGDGYHIVSPLGIQSEADADHFAQVVKEMPVCVKLAPLGSITIGKAFTITVQVTNRGKKPLEYRETSLMGYTTLKPVAIPFSPKEEKLKPEQPGTRIKPGETKTFSTILIPDNTTHAFTRSQKMSCRASVWMKIIDPTVEKWPLSEKNLPVVQGFYAATFWVTANVRPSPTH